MIARSAGLMAACLAGLFPQATPAKPDWLNGEWVFHPRHLIVDSTTAPILLKSDSSGVIYYASPLMCLRNGLWESLPGKVTAPWSFSVTGARDYWTGDPEGLVHHLDGGTRRYNSANSCLDGNLFHLLGRDDAGRLIVEAQSRLGGLGTVRGQFRFSDTGCENLDIVPGARLPEVSIMSYHQDSKGREYFSTIHRSTALACLDFLRLDRGRLDTLKQDTCFVQIISRDDEVLAASRLDGLFFASGSGTFKAKTSIQGHPIPSLTAMFVDSRQVLWLASANERIFAIAPAGTGGPPGDTAVFDHANAGFPDGFAGQFAEDKAGNVWVSFSGGQFSIFARDKGALSVRGIRPGTHSARNAVPTTDALGRHAPAFPANSVERLPRRALFPSPYAQ